MSETINENEKIDIVIRRIKAMSFFIRENLFKPDLPNIQFVINHKIGFNIPMNLVNLTPMIRYFYPENPEEIVMEIEVENLFEINNLIKYIPNEQPVVLEKINLPSDVLKAIVGVSISHARALLADRKSATPFDVVNLPIVNSFDAAKIIFGDKIKN